jgi:hypothetical protein
MTTKKTTPSPPTGPTAAIELITPEWAIRELEKHEDELAHGLYHQRPFSEATAHSYAIAMQNGHWLLNDQGIMFDTNGWLRDGRHRLWAVVMSGVSVEMWVFRNCADKTINGLTIHVVDTVDVGRKRDVGQQLAIDGVSNSNRLAAACRMIARICCLFPPLKLSVIQTRQILAIYGNQATKICDGLHNSKLCKATIVAPLTMYRSFSAGDADQFCADYFGMENLAPGSPVIALQKYFLNNPQSGSHASDLATRATALALSHYAEGGKINVIRHSDLGIQWLLENQKANVAKVREIIGVNFRDHRAA